MSGISNPADLTATTASLTAIAVTQAVILAVVQDTNADLVIVDGNVDTILATTNALPVLTETVGSATTTVINTEYNLYINNAPVGVYEPISCNIWFLNHTATETVVIRTYYRVAAAGVMVLQDELTYAGVVDPALLNIALEANRYGVQVTIERTAGTARAYPWEACFKI